MRSILAFALVLAGCKTTSVYTQGPPRRVTIEKQTGEPTILAEGTRDPDGGATIRVLELREVRVNRTVQHGALELRGEHAGVKSIAWELLELPIGAFMVAVMPISLIWDFAAGGNKRGVKRDPFRPVAILINPARTGFAMKPRVHIARDVTFDGGTRFRQYNVRLPIGELALQYRVLDAGREVLASGDLATDQFGVIRIPAVPPEAVGVELEGGRVKLIAPLDPQR